MNKDTLYVGLDTDKKHIDVTLAEALPGGEVRYWGQIANEASAVARLVPGLALPAHRLMFGEALQALDQATARRDRLTDHIAELVPDWSLAWLVDALQALRGFALINAATVAVEIGDPRRFAKPSQLMAYLGLVPSESSTGDKVR